jgi:Coenzyme PQQ synthesis protein D (PqqD)
VRGGQVIQMHIVADACGVGCRTVIPKAPEELENPPFSFYMVRKPTEIPVLQETAPDVKFMSMELTARVRLAEDVLMQKVGDDAILLNLNTENYFALDEIGTRIIDTLQESDSVAQAVRKLVGIYEVDEGRLTTDAVRLVEECEQHGLLQITQA